MKAKSGPRKDSGLRYGDASKIARIHQCTKQHVIEVAAGRRQGRAALMQTIRRYQMRAAESANSPAAVASRNARVTDGAA